MNIKELKKLAAQHIPQLHDIDPDINDAIEAECTLWQRDDCTLMIEYASGAFDCHQSVAILQHIAQKLAWIEQHRNHIAELIAQQGKVASQHIALQYVAFLVEDANEIFCDFALCSPDWATQMAECSLEDDDDCQFHGFTPI